MSAPDRLVRVNEILKREIAGFLEKIVHLKDSGSLISVVGVSVASNLRTAQVRFSVLGRPEAKEEALKILLDQRKAIQHHIAKNVTLKYTPVLHFQLDENIERGDHVLALLREMEGNDAGKNQ